MEMKVRFRLQSQSSHLAHQRPTPMGVLDGSVYSNETSNISDVDQISGYFGSFSQFPGQEITPAGLDIHDKYGQPDGRLTGQNSFMDTEKLPLDSNTSLGCFCPFDACNCLRQTGCEREQEFCLLPASFQPKVPAKMLKRVPLQDN